MVSCLLHISTLANVSSIFLRMHAHIKLTCENMEQEKNFHNLCTMNTTDKMDRFIGLLVRTANKASLYNSEQMLGEDDHVYFNPPALQQSLLHIRHQKFLRIRFCIHFLCVLWLCFKQWEYANVFVEVSHFNFFFLLKKRI